VVVVVDVLVQSAVVVVVDVLVVVDVEEEVEEVVPTIEYQLDPLYLFHSNSVESK